MQSSLLQANALKIPLTDKSVHCVVTSPPYYGLRDYGTAEWIGGDGNCEHNPQRPDGGERADRSLPLGRGGMYKDVCKCGAKRLDAQLGLEPTLQEYIDNTVLWCREVWRVLRDDGTFWLNLGDSYNGSGGPGSQYDTKATGGYKGEFTKYDNPNKKQLGFKPKDLMLVPHRVAIALQNDGWWVRSDIVWHKPNPMPESVKDRPTKSHEYIFLLTKSGESQFWTHPEKQGTRTKPEPDYLYTHKDTDEETREMPPGDWKKNWKRRNLWQGHDYYYDQDAIREANSPGSIERFGITEAGQSKKWNTKDNKRDGRSDGTKSNEGFRDYVPFGRNKRSVWTMTTKPYKGAHFATFPPELPEICIKAGTSEKGVCPVCGSQWARVIEKETTFESGSGKAGRTPDEIGGKWGDDRYGENILLGPVNKITTLGWKPTCSHNEEPIPATVLDPFGGSGTTAAVAKQLGRVGICMDLSWEYLQLAKKRCGKVEYQYSFIQCSS